MKDTDFRFSPSVLVWPLYLVLALWIVFWIEVQFKVSLTEFGIYPRTLSGLKGIVFSPFLHADISHLYNNSIPLFLLVAALRFFYRKQSLEVLVYGILFSGFGTWLIGRDNFHIGASGLIYVLISFIFFKGIQTNYYRLVSLSLTIVVLYGGMIWYVFPSAEAEISWESHLSGFITGFLLSFFMKTSVYQRPIKYDWEHPDFDPTQDEFMKHFDENGNFAPKPKEIPQDDVSLFFTSNYPIVYEIVPAVSRQSNPEATELNEWNREEE
ncbi:rhomboid family intramembrane serine protease [Flavobacterium humi]|uniref:Rhomboid family intramembrane serine protease n=1 Tax=Flavobacterium humi TaxID=2562683 RepID=A0A4Z0L7D9_9FLAO|nr:rhomboid family intramembrane serine protease [Flavobacterium humi]TGD57076.1 rhomboid family intramembrane serine protease [Flavobacterium humi]